MSKLKILCVRKASPLTTRRATTKDYVQLNVSHMAVAFLSWLIQALMQIPD